MTTKPTQDTPQTPQEEGATPPCPGDMSNKMMERCRCGPMMTQMMEYCRPKANLDDTSAGEEGKPGCC
jgi:hypothetical protein